MSLLKHLIISSILLLLSVAAQAFDHTTTPIKLAIFDGPQISDNTSTGEKSALEHSYLKGITVAALSAKHQGYNVADKVFFYEKNLLDIFEKVPQVRTWDPDVIVGLHTSNEAIMSKNLFSKCLVLSITATDHELSHLAPNFYTLGVPDSYISQALVRFVHQHYPHKNLFIMIGVESKESLDFGHIVANDFKQAYPQHTATIKEYLTNDLLTMKPSTLLEGYHKNDVILMFSIAGTYSDQLKLMQKIGDHLAPFKPTFITTVDNWQGTTLHTTGQNPSSQPYTAYRITNLYVDKSTKLYQLFLHNYQSHYHTKPSNIISYFTFRAVMSFITALQQYPAPKNLSARQAILWSYHQALKDQPNWYRPQKLGVYQLALPKEVFVGTINLIGMQ